MRAVLKIFVITGLVLVILIPAGLVLMVIDPHPHVRALDRITQEDIQRAGQILTPFKPGNFDLPQRTSIEVSENDLNLLLAYGLTQTAEPQRLAVRVHLGPGTAVVYATLQIPASFLGQWINMVLVATPRPNAFDIHQARIGRLPVPGVLLRQVVPRVHTRLMDIPRYATAMAMAEKIQAVDIDDGRLALHFQWDPDLAAALAAEAKKQVFPPDHQKRLADYYNFLVDLTRPLEGKQTSLMHIIKPLFGLALENTALSRDPVAENTAVLQVLATHATNQDLAGYLSSPFRDMLSSVRPDTVFALHGREDLAQHFLSSAAITVLSSGTLARSMGVAKEMDDAASGSGFSFVDITANEAGIRLGEFAVSGPVNARLLQRRMAGLSHEKEFMPDIGNLPENMRSDEFAARFTDTHSAAYARMMNQIESRIDACRIYQN
jgi:hypothetical protein